MKLNYHFDFTSVFHEIFCLLCLYTQRARKFKKSPGQKTHEIKSSIFSKKYFDQNPFFAISKMAENQFLKWENV